MEIATVTTADHGLLRAVRAVLGEADDALLCVAFVQERGLNLLEHELELRLARRATTRLLVTTTFQTTSFAALAVARRLGVEVRVLNPGAGRTFHPKVYLGLAGDRSRAVIGSANLTGGLFSNHEAAVALAGGRQDAPIAAAWDWAERLWADERAETWLPGTAADSEGDVQFDERLFALVQREVARNPVFLTLSQEAEPGRAGGARRSRRRDGTLARADRRRGADPGVDVQPRVGTDRVRVLQLLWEAYFPPDAALKLMRFMVGGEARAPAPDAGEDVSERALEEHLEAHWDETPFAAMGVELARPEKHGFAPTNTKAPPATTGEASRFYGP